MVAVHRKSVVFTLYLSLSSSNDFIQTFNERNISEVFWIEPARIECIGTRFWGRGVPVFGQRSQKIDDDIMKSINLAIGNGNDLLRGCTHAGFLPNFSGTTFGQGFPRLKAAPWNMPFTGAGRVLSSDEQDMSLMIEDQTTDANGGYGIVLMTFILHMGT